MSMTTTQLAPVQPSDRSPSSPPAASLLSDLYRVNVDEYERLVKNGVLDSDRVELIQGLLVKKMGKNPPHVFATARLLAMLESLLPSGWHVRKEEPVRIFPFSEPEPDLAIVSGVLEVYLERHPTPTDVVLLVEVAETTLDRDQRDKQFAYALAEIPAYWIINLIERQVELYTDPKAGAFQTRQVFASGSVVPLIIHGNELGKILVDQILPPDPSLRS
jgi:Uma2 family endonuclease